MFMFTPLACLAAITSVLATTGLELNLSGPAQCDGVDNMKVVTTLKNSGTEQLKILK